MKTRLLLLTGSFVLAMGSAGVALDVANCVPPATCDVLDKFILALDLNVGGNKDGVGVHVGSGGVGVHTPAGGVGVHTPSVDVHVPGVPNIPGVPPVTPPPPVVPPVVPPPVLPPLPPDLPGQIERELESLSPEELAILLSVCDTVRKRPASYSAIKQAICELLARGHP